MTLKLFLGCQFFLFFLKIVLKLNFMNSMELINLFKYLMLQYKCDYKHFFADKCLSC